MSEEQARKTTCCVELHKTTSEHALRDWRYLRLARLRSATPSLELDPLGDGGVCREKHVQFTPYVIPLARGEPNDRVTVQLLHGASHTMAADWLNSDCSHSPSARPVRKADRLYGAGDMVIEAIDMELVIPDGAQVHILVGNAPLPELPSETGWRQTRTGSGKRLLTGVLAALVVLGSFQAGRFMVQPTTSMAAAQGGIAPHKPTATLSSHPADDQGQLADIPPAFRQQVTQPPQFVPPPGPASRPAHRFDRQCVWLAGVAHDPA